MVKNRRRAAEIWLVAGLLASGVACASRPPLPEPGPPAPPVVPAAVAACALAPGGPSVRTMAVDEAVVAARAPRPVTGAERTVFRQVYDTLLRLDCEGGLHPGVAARWARNGDRDDWVVEIDAGARFVDGSPVTAGDVVAGWRAGPGDGSWHAAVSRVVRDASVLDARTLLVTLREAQGDDPRALADAALAVARPVPGAPWPIGTRGRTVSWSDTDGHGPEVVVLPADTDGAQAIRIIVAPARDARDFLDQGVDMLLTRDAPALAYAGTLDRYERYALPWQRTYVWISAARDRAIAPPGPDARERLAATAVRGEARAAGGPSWWTGQTCDGDALLPGPPPLVTGDRIVYDAGDEVARQLAERVVALARGGGGEAAGLLPALLPSPVRAVQRAVGLSGAELERAFASGSERGYVMAVEHEPVLPCAAWRGLRARMPWLDAGALVPLVDTRLHALVRAGLSPGVVDGDGTLRIVDGAEP